MKYRANFKTIPAHFEPVFFVPPTKAKLLETIAAMRPDYDMRPLRGWAKSRLYAVFFKLREEARADEMRGGAL